MDGITAYPLCWPVGQPRNRHQSRANFGRVGGGKYQGDRRPMSIAEARDELLRQVRLLGGTRVTISSNLELRQDGLPYSNQKRPSDPGVAVYFFRAGHPYAMACDTWDTVQTNLYAVARYIDAIRTQERLGVGTLEQAMRGYELPPASPSGWWDVLGVPRDATLEMIEAAYRRAAMQHHPDRGGDPSRMVEINSAVAQARNARAQN